MKAAGRLRMFGRVAVVALALAAAGVASGLIFLYSGLYQIAARDPHTPVVRWALTTLQKRSVSFHASGIEVPPLAEPELVRRGLILYRELCQVCHGAPGVSRERIGIGLNPNPPPLFAATREWSDAELYWITANGLKMAGMPAFGLGEQPGDLWAIVAFLRRMAELSPAEYRAMVAAVTTGAGADAVPWLGDEPSLEEVFEGADPERGREWVDAFGCGTCHVVPGVRGADGKVGPPLVRWAERHFIAGTLVNTPGNLVAWILDPQAIEPATAMPDVGLTPEQALDIAAYLFTLGDPLPRRRP